MKNQQVKRESIEWCQIWITHGDEDALPRVLLIGDSIARAYHAAVEKALEGQAYVGVYATSKSLGDPALLEEVAAVLKQYRFDIVHFNNGMHGWDYTEEEYGRALPELLATMRRQAPAACLVWASTTPVREGQALTLAPRTERVQARNALAQALMTKEGIPINDLFGLLIDRPDYFSPDGVHSSEAGIAAEAAQVAAWVARPCSESLSNGG